MTELAVQKVIAVGVTAVEISPDSPGRFYGLFQNKSNNTIELSFGVPAAYGSGFALSALVGSYEINLTNPWHGKIYAIASAASSNLKIMELSA